MYLTPLAELRFGHEIGINMRAPDTTEPGFSEFVATIRAVGTVQPMLAVKRITGKGKKAQAALYVPVGGRRLAALKRLQAEAFFPPDHQVEVDLRELTDAEALELSVIENMERLPAHPVEVYDALVHLREAGHTEADMAARFGIDDAEVKRRLALGMLALEVREAWRAGEIDADAAKAFTIAPDKAQVMALKALRKSTAGISPSAVIHTLGVKVGKNELRFVGEEAYLAAGGRLHQDLFSDAVFVLDPEVLAGLKAAKLGEEVERLKAEGWKWAETEATLPHNYHTWKQLGHEDLGHFTPEQMAGSGVVVAMNWEGEGFRHQHGLVWPEDTPVAPRPARDPDAASVEPRHVTDLVRGMQTIAWAEVVSGYPAMAMDLLLATWLAGGSPGSGSPICMTFRGPDGSRQFLTEDMGVGQGQVSFGEALAQVQEMRQGERSTLLALMVATTLDMSTTARSNAWNGSGVADGAIEAMSRVFTGDNILKALRQHFDPAVYFDGCPKAVAVDALTEMVGFERAVATGSKSKDVVAGLAAARATERGWLPKSLRVPGYVIQADGARITGREPGRTPVDAAAPDRPGEVTLRFLLADTRAKALHSLKLTDLPISFDEAALAHRIEVWNGGGYALLKNRNGDATPAQGDA